VRELLPDLLKAAWRDVEAGRITAEEFERRRVQWLGEYGRRWSAALLLDGRPDLKTSLLAEIGDYLPCDDPSEVERRCRGAVGTLATEWNQQVAAGERTSVEGYYDRSESYLYDLMWWHSLVDDDGPLAYVTALDFATGRACHDFLDFGAGVGAGGILFARSGFQVTLADISSTLLRFSGRRFESRRLSAQFIDLKTAALPSASFDIVTAMDVFEHLADPVGAIDDIARALKPGGYLYGRFHADIDAERPQHIVSDFAPTFGRLREHGFVEVWRDEWLWGHQVFQRP
jgi:2-polyprenyl-3-methyl-5-hydroxy-6-metoxy-1,4-benzoquinol methylase